MFVLNRQVAVADGSNRLVTLSAGTPIGEIGEREKAQLAPQHFHDPDEPGAVPDDWRDDAVRERDREQAEALAAYRGGN